MNNKLMPITCEKAKHIINACIDDGYPLNTYKLEKLLLLINGYTFKKENKLFFEENIKITKNSGFRIPIIYKWFIANSVEFVDKCIEYICLLDYEKDAIDWVLRKYGNMDAIDLTRFTNLCQTNSLFEDGKMVDASIVAEMFSRDIIHGYEDFEENQQHQSSKSLTRKLTKDNH